MLQPSLLGLGGTDVHCSDSAADGSAQPVDVNLQHLTSADCAGPGGGDDDDEEERSVCSSDHSSVPSQPDGHGAVRVDVLNANVERCTESAGVTQAEPPSQAEPLEPPPLCDCNRRAKLGRVSAASPNFGRAFWTCDLPVTLNDRCNFFAWALMAPAPMASALVVPSSAPAVPSSAPCPSHSGVESASVPLRIHTIGQSIRSKSELPVGQSIGPKPAAAADPSASERTVPRESAVAGVLLSTGTASSAFDSQRALPSAGALLLSALDSLSSALSVETPPSSVESPPSSVQSPPGPVATQLAERERSRAERPRPGGRDELEALVAIADVELFAAQCLEQWLALVPALRRKRINREAAHRLRRTQLVALTHDAFAAWRSAVPDEATRLERRCAIGAIGARRSASLMRCALACWHARVALLARVQSLALSRQRQTAPICLQDLKHAVHLFGAWRGFCKRNGRLRHAELRARNMLAVLAVHRISVCFYAWLTHAQRKLFIAAISSRAWYVTAAYACVSTRVGRRRGSGASAVAYDRYI